MGIGARRAIGVVAALEEVFAIEADHSLRSPVPETMTFGSTEPRPAERSTGRSRAPIRRRPVCAASEMACGNRVCRRISSSRTPSPQPDPSATSAAFTTTPSSGEPSSSVRSAISA